MATSKNIWKPLFIGLWCCAAAGILVLLLAAIKVKSNKTCSGYTITINAGKSELFVDKKVVEKILMAGEGYTFTNRKISSIDLNHLEEMLEKNPWIKNADLYFDNNQSLRIRIEQRQPVARVFTRSGNSFYIDTSGTLLPVPTGSPARVAVFTGLPAENVKHNSKDSVVMRGVLTLSDFLLQHPFWMAQVQQVTVTPAGTFEIIPSIGNQVIEFGSADDCEKKFNNLLLFYRQVMRETGFNAYSRIRLQYNGEVVAVRRNSTDASRDVKAIKRMPNTVIPKMESGNAIARQN